MGPGHPGHGLGACRQRQHAAASVTGQPVAGVRDLLREGKAVIGWSYNPNLDLRKVKEKVEAGEELSPQEADAVPTLPFLDIKVGDIIAYTHQPRRDVMLFAEVTGEYEFDESGNIGTDFRSYLPCRLLDGLGAAHSRVPKLPSSGRVVKAGKNRVAVLESLEEYFE